ncbi:MAG TPA: hypothetical protein VFV23_02475 [Verrucomicrobiae bacterium]|nr:hypothetical protein [Verrucomicrobiae bacterium]
MRTKTLILAAVAAFGVGIFTSQAAVTSANVVGYANVVVPNGGTYLVSVPFNVGVSNGANEIWPGTSLPDFSSVLVWNSQTFSYTTYYSDSGSPSGWDDINFNPLSGAPTLPVGQGFFLIPSANVTNTFTGSVAVNVGTSNQMFLANGGTYLVSSVVPYAGSVTNGNNSSGGLNLSSAGGLPDFSSILIWDPNTFSYTTYYSDSGSPSGWDDINFNPLPAPPTVNVGQGFFLIPAGDFNWTVGL